MPVVRFARDRLPGASKHAPNCHSRCPARFALCGILTVNVAPLLITEPVPGNNPVELTLALGVQERFFPIFALLFGVGFGIMLTSATRRAQPFRAAMARRFGFLLALGALHHLLQPGEALLPYAICGFLILLPASWLPRWAIAALTVPAVAAGVAAGGVFVVPGMFLLGYTLAQFDVPRRLEGRPAMLWSGALAVVCGLAAVPMVRALAADESALGFSALSAGAGLVMATGYVSLVVFAMNTPVRGVLTAVFAPLGRMALTNYITATLLLLAAKPFVATLGIADSTSGFTRMLLLCLGIVAVQWVASRLWLARFGQGPLEQLWRRITWLNTRDQSPVREAAPVTL